MVFGREALTTALLKRIIIGAHLLPVNPQERRLREGNLGDAGQHHRLQRRPCSLARVRRQVALTLIGLLSGVVLLALVTANIVSITAQLNESDRTAQLRLRKITEQRRAAREASAPSGRERGRPADRETAR